jgi:hypothetical protein
MDWIAAFDWAWLIAMGLCIGFVCAYVDEERNIAIGWLCILWALLAVGYVSNTAGAELGKTTIQISGGRDPEVETVDTRQVSDAERWRAAEKFEGTAFPAIAIGLIASFILITQLRKRGWDWVAQVRSLEGEKWKRIDLFRVRAGAVLVVIVLYLSWKALQR